MDDPHDLKRFIRTVPDFPEPGILFRDVTTLFADAEGFRLTVESLAEPFKDGGVDLVVGLDARGFIVGGAAAQILDVGFVAIRKAGKLPGATIEQAYQLEYGEAVLEVQDDAIAGGQRVLIVDDLLATGGTAAAAVELVQRLGGVVVGCAFVVDLPELGGRVLLEGRGVSVHALCEFDGH